MTLRDEIIAKTRSVTSIPAAAMQAMKILQDPNANMGEVVQVIAYDPGLTSNILKLANSSYFGCSKAISSLRDAVVRLGAGNILKLVTASIANVALSRGIRGYNLAPGELWEHSIATAVGAETLADLIKQKQSKLAFTGGLLHDIGKVVLGRFIDQRRFLAIMEILNSGKTFDDAETEVLGIDHAEVGAILLAQWNIPDALGMAVRWHHQPDQLPDDPTPSLVNAADYLCVSNNIGTREGAFAPAYKEQVFQSMNLDDSLLTELIDRTRNSVDNIKDVFSKRD